MPFALATRNAPPDGHAPLFGAKQTFPFPRQIVARPRPAIAAAYLPRMTNPDLRVL
jgi:hypothetical protein